MKRRDPKGGGKEAVSSPTSSNKQQRGKGSTSPPQGATYEPRRSTRVSADKYTHDGDSWQETLAVCETANKSGKGGETKMIVRSYYSNQRTGERMWDEPPSGATRVLPATEEMRKMAELQLQEMQITFAPPSSPEKQDATKDSRPTTKKKGFFRRRKEDVATPKEERTGGGKIQYKPGSFLARVRRESSSPKKSRPQDDTLDPEVQKAIALSMQQGDASSGPANDEETLAMAMALSLSEAETSQRQLNEDEMLKRAMKQSKQESYTPMTNKTEGSNQTYTPLSEEELFQRAVEQTKRESSTSNVAAMPLSTLSLSSSTGDEQSARSDRKLAPDELEDDRKMPAIPRSTKHPNFVPGQSVRKKSTTASAVDSSERKAHDEGRPKEASKSATNDDALASESISATDMQEEQKSSASSLDRRKARHDEESRRASSKKEYYSSLLGKEGW